MGIPVYFRIVLIKERAQLLVDINASQCRVGQVDHDFVALAHVAQICPARKGDVSCGNPGLQQRLSPLCFQLGKDCIHLEQRVRGDLGHQGAGKLECGGRCEETESRCDTGAGWADIAGHLECTCNCMGVNRSGPAKCHQMQAARIDAPFGNMHPRR